MDVAVVEIVDVFPAVVQVVDVNVAVDLVFVEVVLGTVVGVAEVVDGSLMCTLSLRSLVQEWPWTLSSSRWGLITWTMMSSKLLVCLLPWILYNIYRF